MLLPILSILATHNPSIQPTNEKQKLDRPNILWLSFEDASASEFGCYGNQAVNTPIIDSLAANGVQYMQARSAAPQSSPARSSLITGCYATTYAMDLHPVAVDTPEDIFFISYLRGAGYYCVNNRKTHYNTTQNNKLIWDECGDEASYNSPNRHKDQPFFAVYNSVRSHMGIVRTIHTKGRRDYKKEGIDISKLTIPEYLPDDPIVRSDWGAHLEGCQDIDKWVGLFLQDLKEKNLSENTIIFIFSDHGGCLPRGKGYLYESGLRVPLIVYVPDKYKDLVASEKGINHRLVNFTDFAPTVLSLAGLETPKSMQGEAFLGKYQKKAKKYDIGFSTNQLQHFMPVRTVTDGKYKYIRTYIPYYRFALRNYYQWGMPANQLLDSLYFRGELNHIQSLPYLSHNAEMLFDLDEDLNEVNDLSSRREYLSIKKELSKILDRHISESVDLGFFIPSERQECNIHNLVHQQGYNIKELYKLTNAIFNPTKKNLSFASQFLSSESPSKRFWAVVAFANAFNLATSYNDISYIQADTIAQIRNMMDDNDKYVAAHACIAIAYYGKLKKSLQVEGNFRNDIEKAIEKLLKTKDCTYAKALYSALEELSLEEGFKSEILKHKDRLLHDANTLPIDANEDLGFMARGILVNLGVLKPSEIYKELYDKGLKLNKRRRPNVPLP